MFAVLTVKVLNADIFFPNKVDKKAVNKKETRIIIVIVDDRLIENEIINKVKIVRLTICKIE